MNLTEQLNLAIELALSAHNGQFDTHNGRPYIEHPFRVMNAGHTLQEKIVGVLHDVVEDSDMTLTQLKVTCLNFITYKHTRFCYIIFLNMLCK